MTKKNIYMLLCFLSILILFGCSVKSEPVKLFYYYFSACGACNESQKFYDMADSALEGIDNSKYEIITVNTFKEAMPESLRLFLEANGLKAEDMSYPMLTSGNNYITGLENIEKNMRELLQSSINGKSFSPGKDTREATEDLNGQEGGYKATPGAVDKNSSYFLYFYTSSCSACNNTEEFLKTLPGDYKLNIDAKLENSRLVIDHRNITQENNLVLLQSLFEYYDVPKDEREVPFMFYSKGYISGYDNIKNNIEKIISRGEALNFDYDRLNQKDNIKNLTPENIPGIFLTGLINGLNPCSISMLFLLLSLVISKKSNILKIGFSYVAGKMAAYLSFGLAAYNIITLIDSRVFRNVQYGISIFMILMSLILALLNFRDAYWSRKEMYNNVKMQLPGALRKYNHRIITFFAEKADSGWTVFAIFILGVIISLGEFLCTGQIYVATIVYLAQNTSQLGGTTVLSFILYVLAASLPLITLVILVNRTKRLLQISELVRKHMPLIKLIFGVTFLIFGLIFAAYIL